MVTGREFLDSSPGFAELRQEIGGKLGSTIRDDVFRYPPPGKDLFLKNFDYFLRLAISEREHLYPFCVVIYYDEEISILFFTERERTHQIHPQCVPWLTHLGVL